MAQSNIENIYGLTPLQEGMFFFNQLEVDGSKYILQYLLAIDGSLDTELLRKSFDLLALKYDVLRTAFIMPQKSTHPVQVLLRNRRPEVNFEDISNIPEAERAVHRDAIIARDLKRGFSLDKDSLIRATLIQESASGYSLLWSIHHIIIDGWCTSFLFRDVMTYYDRLVLGEDYAKLCQEAQLDSKNQLSYASYIKWLNSLDKNRFVDYWQKKLSGYQETASIAPWEDCDSRRSGSAECKLQLESHICAGIGSLSEECSVTVNSVLEAAWGLLLKKYSGLDDVVFGKVHSGRNIPLKGVGNAVGLFINTIPVRMASEPQTIGAFLRAVQEESLESMEMSFCSLSDIQKSIEKRGALFDTLFVFENYIMETEKQECFGNATITFLSSREETNYPINLVCSAADGQIELKLLYDASIYTGHNAQMILQTYAQLLSSLSTAHASSAVADLAYISQQDFDHIVYDLNKTETQIPNHSIGEEFVRQVRKYPEKTAIRFNDKKLTYSQLYAKAISLAKTLAAKGVGVDSPVVISGERSVEYIIAMVAVTLSGGAYVPIAGDMPLQRKQQIIEDCRPTAILTMNDPVLDSHYDTIRLSKETVFHSDPDEVIAPLIQNSPEDLVYIMFTSGTTGKPKGAMINHMGVMRVVKNQNYLRFDENLVTLQLGALSFDAATFEIWGALLNGGRLELADRDTIMNTAALKAKLVESGVNAIFVTTTLFNKLVSDDSSVFDSVGTVLFGGEKASERHALKVWERHTVTLLNAYGPTETTTFALMHEIKSMNKKLSLPIGKAISNTKLYIMRDGKLCGYGMPGELYIAGIGLGRGYLNNPELTARKFIDNPFGEGKIYASGDLVMLGSDDRIHYLGRVDEQVKLRGFRIELGDIQSALCAINGISQATAVIFESQNNEKILTAYYVSDIALDNNTIKRELKKILPSYMIPASLTRIDQIPFNRNGKIDKTKLPNPIALADEETQTPVISDEYQRIVARAFSEALGVSNVSPEDNFFDIGGHSLRAEHTINLIAEYSGVKLRISDIFVHPVVADLAKCVKNGTGEHYERIPCAASSDYYPLSAQQLRMFVMNEMGGLGTAYNMPQAVKISGKMDIKRAENVIREIISRHEILRTSFHLVDGVPMQRIHENVEVPFRFVQAEEIAAENSNDFLRRFVQPFDLSQAPLLRLFAVSYPDGSTVLIFDMHHIVGDGFSVNLLITEFSALYEGRKLEPQVSQYKDYCCWYHSRNMSAQADYWKSVFSDEIPVLNMPTDYPRKSTGKSFAGGYVCAEIDAASTEKMRVLCAEHGATEFMFLLSVYSLLLSKYSGSDDIVVGAPVSGRTHRDTERMFGLFVNSLALRTKVPAHMPFGQYLDSVRDVCLSAFENQNYPFEQLVENLDIKCDFSRNPLFDTILVVQNNEDVKLVFDDAQVEKLSIGLGVSKLDLEMELTPEENGGYRIRLGYCSDLFKKETAQLLLLRFRSLVKTVLSSPDKQLKDLSITMADEADKILNQFNNTAVLPGKAKTMVELFLNARDKDPQAQAIVSSRGSLTYEELDNASDSVTAWLQNHGVGLDDYVAIIADRSPETFVSILGVLKSGAAYVPVDAGYPQAHSNYILERSKPAAVIVTAKDFGPASLGVPTLVLQDAALLEKSNTPPQYILNPESTAYVIFTSGTTGKPKGVIIKNSAVANFSLYFEKNHPMDRNTRMLQFFSPAFDASVTEMLMSIFRGATLCIVPDDQRMDAEKFAAYLASENVTDIILPPAFAAEVELPDCVRNVITAGSASNLLLARKLSAGGRRYSNDYGPTEATVCATHWEYTKDWKQNELPIGKPIENKKVYILDGCSLCGIGIVGELCVGGEGLAVGYLGDPEQTKEKFIDNPFGQGRLYRTGDLARWLPDGNILFMGRKDNQLKINGFRVEIDGIENAMRSLASVKDVTVINAGTGDLPSVAAFYTLEGETDNVGAHVREILPFYMVPRYLVRMEAIPLNNSGKPDKKALLECLAKQSITREDIVAATTGAERLLTDLMSQLFGCEVGTTHSFLELGGDSIKAIRLLPKLREHGYEISAGELISAPSIKETALCLRPVAVEKYEQGEVKGTAPFNPTIAMFNSWNFAKPDHFSQAIALGSASGFDIDGLNLVFSALIRHHDVFRTRFSNSLQTVLDMESCPAVLVECHDYNYAYDSAQEQANAEISKECTRLHSTMNREQAILIKPAVFRFTDKAFLVISVHHFAIDTVSWNILMDDFATAYQQSLTAQPIVLPPKTLSYMQWASALEEYAESAALVRERKYWETIAAHVNPGQLPCCDSPRPEKAELTVEFDESFTQHLLNEAGRAYTANPEDVLLAALSIAVGRVFACNSIAVDMESHGRGADVGECMRIDRTVGWFTSVYPVAVGVCENIGDMLVRTKEALHNVPNTGVGFGVLKYLAQEKLVCRKPDIAFNYFGTINDPQDSWHALTLADIPLGNLSAPENDTGYCISVNSQIRSGCLKTNFAFAAGCFDDETAESLCGEFAEALYDIAEHCEGVDTTIRTAVDVGASDLDDHELAKLNELLR